MITISAKQHEKIVSGLLSELEFRNDALNDLAKYAKHLEGIEAELEKVNDGNKILKEKISILEDQIQELKSKHKPKG